MDPIIAFLLNPNTIYLILVLGFVLAIVAFISPGTGVVELSAIFLLIVAGWGASQSEINWWAAVILVLGVIPFILAVRKYRHPAYLAISVLSLVIGSAYLFRGESWWKPAVNPFLAVMVTLLAGGYVWFGTIKALEAARVPPKHDLEALIGAVGEAKTDIQQEGSVQVAGELWSAESEQFIPQGARIKVVGRQGFILQVESYNHKAAQK